MFRSRVYSLVKGHKYYQGGESMYQALYRKWRPRTFEDVVGQAHITDTIKRQVAANRL